MRNAVAKLGSEGSQPSEKPTWLKVLQGLALAPVMIGGYVAVNYMAGGTADGVSNPQSACLSRSDGSMPQLVQSVKQHLREPDSFQLIQTIAKPVGDDGMQHIWMSFRARNGFGGINVNAATGTVDHPSCTLLNWRLIED
jgi:hypothetical protein